jgi:ABC-type antimicrobial peptide transport system permease subunit
LTLSLSRPKFIKGKRECVLNYGGDQGYTLVGKNAVICGSEESWTTQMQTGVIEEGVFPQMDNEAMITKSAKTMLGLQIGDQITVDTPDGTSLQFTISGFSNNFTKTMDEDIYGIFLTTNEFRSIYPGVTNGEPADYNSIYYVQFSTHCNMKKTINDMKSQFGLSDKQISENTKLMGLLGQSGDSFMLQIYGSATVLFLLVLLAGIMMIASSLNSDVAQRTEFFGMMRCIGATPKQVMRFVIKEALGWCKLDEVQHRDNTGLVVFGRQNTTQAGDTVTLHIGNKSPNIIITGSLSSSPFNSAPGVGTIICSENTFRQLTGQTDYTIIDLQLSKNATETDVDEIHRITGSEVIFSDRRSGNRSVIGSYYSFALFIYGFMTLIALITIFNIVNSIAMSVLARMKQYGAFRAIGLSNRQLIKMIIAEALTYAVTGSFCGVIVGLLLNKFLFAKLVTFHWGEQWNIPFAEIIIIIEIVILSVILAVQGPAKRIRNMSIVDTISAQ